MQAHELKQFVYEIPEFREGGRIKQYHAITRLPIYDIRKRSIYGDRSFKSFS